MQTSTTIDKASLPRRWMQPAAVLLWVLIWQLAAMAVNIPLLLPSPLAVLQRLWQLCGEGEFWYTVLTSLCRILLGFAAGVAGGVLLAAAAWRWQFVQAMVRPMVGVLKSTPVASFIILALVWVKTEQLATLISFIMVLPLVYNNLCQGIAAADPKLLEMAKVFELSGWKTFRCCYLPAILPFFLSAVSSALGLAWKSGIAAEVLGRPLTAIGTKIYESKVYLETADLFAWTLVIILLSVALERLLLRATDRVKKEGKAASGMQLRDLTLQYDGVRVLEHLNLTLPDSGLVCILAPSGTGKTTLLNLFCGLLKPDGGRIEGLEDRKFAYVFQEDRLVPQLTARENIRLVMEQPDDQWICQMMEQLGLAGWEDALPQELSGGMQRRVAIARAFAYGKQYGSRTVYLLDEPLKGLDEQAAAQTLALIRERVGGALAFWITHDRTQAQAADWIVCFEGRPMHLTQLIDIRKKEQ